MRIVGLIFVSVYSFGFGFFVCYFWLFKPAYRLAKEGNDLFFQYKEALSSVSAFLDYRKKEEAKKRNGRQALPN